MQTLITDLLTFSRVTTKPRPFVPVDLSAVAQTIVSDLEVSIQRVSGTVQIEPVTHDQCRSCTDGAIVTEPDRECVEVPPQ